MITNTSFPAIVIAGPRETRDFFGERDQLWPNIAQPQHLEAHHRTVKERKALAEAVPTIERLLVNRGRADINGDAATLYKACYKFQQLFNTGIQVKRLQFVAINME